MGIQQRFTSVAHPQAKGQTEVTNRTILRAIKTRLSQAKGLWEEDLHNVIWAYRTTQRRATKETPFTLVYGIEAVIQPELDLITNIVANFEIKENIEARQFELDVVK